MSYRAKMLQWYLDHAAAYPTEPMIASEYARCAFIVAARLIAQNCPERP